MAASVGAGAESPSGPEHFRSGQHRLSRHGALYQPAAAGSHDAASTAPAGAHLSILCHVNLTGLCRGAAGSHTPSATRTVAPDVAHQGAFEEFAPGGPSG